LICWKRKSIEGKNVVDVGAKIGVYSLAFSKFVGSTGTVFSFEPTPDSFIVLKKNIDVNQLKNIVVEQKAITDKNDVEYLEINEFDGNSRINNNCEKGIAVDCVSLDNYFDSNKEISFVKIDVEGLEHRVLSGMKNLLKNNNKIKILLEYYPKLMVFHGFTPERILEDLTEQGFSLFDLEFNYVVEQSVEHFVKSYNNTNKVTNILVKKIAL